MKTPGAVDDVERPVGDAGEVVAVQLHGGDVRQVGERRRREVQHVRRDVAAGPMAAGRGQEAADPSGAAPDLEDVVVGGDRGQRADVTGGRFAGTGPLVVIGRAADGDAGGGFGLRDLVPDLGVGGPREALFEVRVAGDHRPANLVGVARCPAGGRGRRASPRPGRAAPPRRAAPRSRRSPPPARRGTAARRRRGAPSGRRSRRYARRPRSRPRARRRRWRRVQPRTVSVRA